MNKPKIYVFVNSRWNDRNVEAIAVAEDGEALTGHTSSSVGYARGDMGLHANHDWSGKREKYAAKYPDGYELVDLLDAGPMSDPGCAAMIEKANEAAANKSTLVSVRADASEER